jgi:hypothetical protein
MTKGVTKIVHSNQRQAHPIPGFSPGVIINPRDAFTFVRKNVLTVFASFRFNHASGDPIQHDDRY